MNTYAPYGTTGGSSFSWMSPQQRPATNTAGLDPSGLSYTPGQTWGGGSTSFSTRPQTTYSGPGGNWTSTGNGPWTSSTGQTVSDLPGYLQMQQQRTTASDVTPFLKSYTDLLTNPSSIESDPGYKFAKQQGEEAINRSAAAKGMLNSGGVLAELEKYGSGLATQAVGQRANMLSQALRGAENFGLQSGYFPQQQAKSAAPSWSSLPTSNW